MTKCVFCDIVAGIIPANFIYEDKKIVVFPDIRPKATIHLLVVTKQHIPSLKEITEEHTDLIHHMMSMLPKIAQTQGLNRGFRTIINTGPASGQEIDHLHLHLLGGQLPKF